MRLRYLPLIVALIVVALVGIRWFSRPVPGVSVFRNWTPNRLGKTWTITGTPTSTEYTFVDSNGAFQPRSDSYALYYFLYDRDLHRLYSPILGNVRVRRSLVRGCLPAPCVSWDTGGVDLDAETFAIGGACYSDVAIRNDSHSPRRLSLFVAAMPCQVTGRMLGYQDVGYDRPSRSIVVEGKVLLSCDMAPTAGAAMSIDPTNDITSYIRTGVLPRSGFLRGQIARAASAAVQFDLALEPGSQKRFGFRSPLAGLFAKEARDDFEAQWRERLSRVELTIPDKQLADCFNASSAYLIMLSADGKPVPGPAKYRAFWLRDCAYMADALYYAGQQDLIPPALKQICAMQLPSGGFMPKVGTRSCTEFDALGEAIYALVQHYRRTHDSRWLAQVWPGIASACGYVRRMRSSGILPASISAEDLGSGSMQHYWDDFWCIRGLRDAAFAASELGKPKDAAWIDAEAQSLYLATRASIDAAMRSHSISYIPNGPDEVVSSAMARGTSCALWPCAALDPADRLVKNSFDTYWEKWIAPSNGGFVHKGHYWPYAGLDLAQGYMMLGERERAWKMLRWTLDHDPTHGLFSWPEGMSRKDLTLAEGDMPHGWMCSGVVSLVRNMLVTESGRDLVLLSGVPSEWLKPGAEIAIRDFPTEFGKVSYRAVVSGGKLKLSISGAKPAGSYRVVLPGNRVSVVSRDAREAQLRIPSY